MTAHQHWVFSITTTHLLAIVRRLPTATVPPAPLPIPLGCFPLNTKSTAEAQLTAQSTAEQSQQSSWDSQASPGQAGPCRCRTSAMTYRRKSCWVWWLHEPPDQSPRLKPGWRNTITKTQPKLNSLSLLREVWVPVCSGAFKQSNSVERNCCRDAYEDCNGTPASAKKSGKQPEYPWIPA